MNYEYCDVEWGNCIDGRPHFCGDLMDHETVKPYTQHECAICGKVKEW